MATLVDLMNTIKTNGSAEYQARVPDATETNITAIGNAILAFDATTNEFITTLLNRIALTMVHNRLINNPLAPLKKGGLPLGDSIQEIITNPATAETYGDGNEDANMFTTTTPDTYTLYHKVNRKDRYPITIKEDLLENAFLSYERLGAFLESIVTSLYSGDNIDEYILMKNLFAEAITGSKIPVFDVDNIEASGGAVSFVKTLRKTALLMQQPGSNFNKFKAINAARTPAVVTKDIITYTPPENLVLLIRADVLTELDVDVLAKAFNLSYSNFIAQHIVVDTFGSASDTYAVLCDKALVQVYDRKYKIRDFNNGKNLSTNFYLHHWQVLSLSYFANAAAFKYTAPAG